MISDKMAKALNQQIQLEMESAYLYLAMAAQFEDQNLPGFAHWLKIQHQEETGHGMRLFNYLAERNGKIVLEAIAKPAEQFGSPTEVFQTALGHERKVTAAIYKLHELAQAEKDYATQSFLKWFIDEQVEEEKSAEEVLRQLEMIGARPELLLMIDQRLGERKAD